MASVQLIYSEAVHESFPTYHANFPPNNQVGLGDIGTLRNGVFDRQGSITSTFRLPIPTAQVSKASGEFKFSSRCDMEFGADVAASGGPLGSARASVSFPRGNGIFFAAAGCTTDSLDDSLSLYDEMLRRFEAGTWDSSWVVVTALLRAEALTLLVSAEAGARIELAAETGTVIDFTDVRTAAGLRVANQRAMSFTWLSDEPAAPLLRLAGIRRKWRFFGKGRIVQNYAVEGDPTRLADDRDRALAEGRNFADIFEVGELHADDVVGR